MRTMSGMEFFKVEHVHPEGLSAEAIELDRIASAASRDAVQAARECGLSVTVLDGEEIVRISPDGTKTFVKKLEPLCLSGSE